MSANAQMAPVVANSTAIESGPHRPELFRPFADPGFAQATYLAVIIASGVSVLLASIRQLNGTEYALRWLILAGLTVVGGFARLRLPNVPVSFSISDSFTIAAALWFGPAAGALTVAIDSLVMSVQLARRKFVLRRLLFNATAPPLAMWLAAHAFFLLVGVDALAHSAISLLWLFGPLVVFVGLYFGLNTGLIAGAIAFEQPTRISEIWRRHFMPLWLSYFGGAAIAALLIALISSRPSDLVVFAFIVPIPLILYAAFKHAIGRIEDQYTHLEHVNRMHLATIEALATAIEAKDGVTHDHIRRVQRYAIRLAKAMGVTDPAIIKAIEAAALLHDTGKLAVPEHILNKPGKLTPAEFETMKRHVDVGAEILSAIDFPYPVVPIVQCHHESWDGSGYPRGLKGTDIPVGARVLAVVDCFDALTSDRPYRRALTEAAAIEVLLSRRGTMYDPQVVDAFLHIYRECDTQSSSMKNAPSANGHVVSQVRTATPVSIAAAIDDNLEHRMDAPVVPPRASGGDGVLDEVVSLLTAAVQSHLPDATCVVYLPADGDTLISRCAAGRRASMLRGLTITRNRGLSGWVAVNRETIVNSDAALDLEIFDAAHGPRMCISTPLLDGAVLVGVLTVYTESPLPITQDQCRIVQLLAPYVARIASGSSVMRGLAPSSLRTEPRRADWERARRFSGLALSSRVRHGKRPVG